jgi:nicotinamide-nucleotide amidase
MACGLLETENCNVAIATTGIAGPLSDKTDKPVGLCYIAIGFNKEIEIYKYYLKGNRQEITQTAINAAIFLTLKKIK